jgi:hypothetical protein
MDAHDMGDLTRWRLSATWPAKGKRHRLHLQPREGRPGQHRPETQGAVRRLIANERHQGQRQRVAGQRQGVDAVAFGIPYIANADLAVRPRTPR